MTSIDDDDRQFHHSTLLDYFRPGEFGRVHGAILLAGRHGLSDTRFLNRLLDVFITFGEGEMPLEQKDAERLFGLIDRAMEPA
jgi:hypothetical protein